MGTSNDPRLPSAPLHPAELHRPSALAGIIPFVGLYLLSVYWLAFNDVRNAHFYHAGVVYILYNAARTVLIGYMTWLIYFIGWLVIDRMARRGIRFSLQALDGFLLAFFVGVALLNLAMIALGFLNLYYHSVAVVITTALLAVSYPHLAKTITRARQVGMRMGMTPINVALGTIAVLLLIHILITRALFPTWDHDCLTHYNHYYDTVVHHHGVWPNEVWYHYYFTKGAGLMFLAVLLTDHLGAQLATFSLFAVSVLTMYSLVAKLTNNAFWPLTAAVVYLATFIHTVGPDGNHWGVFQKQHEMMGAMLATLLWMAVLFPAQPVAVQRPWVFLWLLNTASLVAFLPTAFALVFPLFAVGVLYYLVTRRWHQARSYLFLTCGTFLTLLVMLSLNYATTGMHEITPMRLFWPLADQESFSRWVSPYLMIYLFEGSGRVTGSANLFDYDLDALAGLFRLDRLHLFAHPYVLGVLLLAGASYVIARRRWPSRDVLRVVAPVFALLAIAIVISPIGGNPISRYRYYSFTVFFVVVAGVALWVGAFDAFIPTRWQKTTMALVGSVLILSALIAPVRDGAETLRAQTMSQLKFALGLRSFSEAFADMGVYSEPVARAREFAGRAARIWYFHQSPVMGAVPGRPLETDPSYGYPDWHTMLFAEPEDARRAFESHGINYFLWDGTRPLFGGLPFSPLFAPGNIENYFEVAWQENNVFLLTWRGSSAAGIPITRGAPGWAQRLAEPGYRDLYERVRLYYEANEQRPFPVYDDPTLPPVRGWQ